MNLKKMKQRYADKIEGLQILITDTYKFMEIEAMQYQPDQNKITRGLHNVKIHRHRMECYQEIISDLEVME